MSELKLIDEVKIQFTGSDRPIANGSNVGGEVAGILQPVGDGSHPIGKPIIVLPV